jgi:hypothetical protein
MRWFGVKDWRKEGIKEPRSVGGFYDALEDTSLGLYVDCIWLNGVSARCKGIWSVVLGLVEKEIS